MEGTKLNLGGGRKWEMPGWDNLEHCQGYDLDLNLLSPYESNSVEKIFTSHCLEHLEFRTVAALLVECHRVLKPGGMIRVICPNVEKMLDAPKIKTLLGWPWLIGAPEMPDYKAHDHKSHFSVTTMRLFLQCAGFQEIWELAWDRSQDPEFLIPTEFFSEEPPDHVTSRGFVRKDLDSFFLEAVK